MTILEVFVRPNLKEMSDEKGMIISRVLCKYNYIIYFFKYLPNFSFSRAFVNYNIDSCIVGQQARKRCL